MAQVKEQETVLDVVCGTGIKPEQAMARRTYRGRTYYFCCEGCAEAFDRDPVAYIGEDVIRAYTIEDRVRVGAEPEQVRQAEEATRRYGAEINAAEQRARAARENVDRLQRELADARNALAKRRDEERMLSAREEELRAMPEGVRITDLEERLVRERTELSAAERALADARRTEQAMLIRERAEAADLEGRQRMLRDEIEAEQGLARELEMRTSELDKLRKELEQDRTQMAQRQNELLVLDRRIVELRARPSGMAVGEIERQIQQNQAELERTQRDLAAAEQAGGAGVDLRARVDQARKDFEQAQQQLAEARMRVEAIQIARPADIEDMENRHRAMEAELKALDLRARDIEGRLSQLDQVGRQASEARAMLNRRIAEMESLGKRSDEIRAEIGTEDRRVAGMAQQSAKERADVEDAQRALAEARMRAEEMARRRRAELAELRERRARLGPAGAEEARARDLEARIGRLQQEADEAERRINDLRRQEQDANRELERLKRERREVVLEGLPSVEGEEPAEFYRAERVHKGQRSRS